MKKVISLLLICFYPFIGIIAQEKEDWIPDYDRSEHMYGYRNHKKKLVIKHKFTFAEPFREDLAVVEKNLKFGYIDRNGEFIILPKFADAGAFSEGLAYFSNDAKHYGYIDKTGNIFIEPKFDKTSDFKNGYATVYKTNQDTIKFGKRLYLEGLIDRKGNLIGEQWFSSVGYQNDSTVIVSIKNIDFLLNLINGEIKQERIRDSLSEKMVFMKVDVMPEFPGGIEKMQKYVAKNVHYPVSAREHGIQGKTFTRFAVSETGDIINISISKSVYPLLDKESIRVVKSFPKWKPGKQKGKPIIVWYTLPINFTLQ